MPRKLRDSTHQWCVLSHRDRELLVESGAPVPDPSVQLLHPRQCAAVPMGPVGRTLQRALCLPKVSQGAPQICRSSDMPGAVRHPRDRCVQGGEQSAHARIKPGDWCTHCRSAAIASGLVGEEYPQPNRGPPVPAGERVRDGLHLPLPVPHQLRGPAGPVVFDDPNRGQLLRRRRPELATARAR
jgi:hypothetical protein